MQNKCVSFLIFSQDNLGFAFRHSLPCKLKVPNDDCDCPLYFSLFVLPNIDWFPLSPACVTHALWATGYGAMKRSQPPSQGPACVALLGNTHLLCIQETRLLSLDFCCCCFKTLVFSMNFSLRIEKPVQACWSVGTWQIVPHQCAFPSSHFIPSLKQHNVFQLLILNAASRVAPKLQLQTYSHTRSPKPHPAIDFHRELPIDSNRDFSPEINGRIWLVTLGTDKRPLC